MREHCHYVKSDRLVAQAVLRHVFKSDLGNLLLLMSCYRLGGLPESQAASCLNLHEHETAVMLRYEINLSEPAAVILLKNAVSLFFEVLAGLRFTLFSQGESVVEHVLVRNNLLPVYSCGDGSHTDRIA